METIKAQFAGFIKVNGILIYEGGNAVETKIRLNPNAITSYFDNEIDVAGEKIKVTTVYCGHQYHVYMSLYEFDNCMEEIDRGISFEQK